MPRPSSSAPAPISDRVGDVITVQTLSGDFGYVVASTAVVSSDAVGVLRPTSEPTLTLVTCFPVTYLGGAPDRFIVRAREVTGGAHEVERFAKAGRDAMVAR